MRRKQGKTRWWFAKEIASSYRPGARRCSWAKLGSELRSRSVDESGRPLRVRSESNWCRCAVWAGGVGKSVGQAISAEGNGGNGEIRIQREMYQEQE